MTEFFAGMSVMAVELLGMRVIDELISDELHYYRGIFEKEGIEGLMKAL